jgi:hypothetical protein
MQPLMVITPVASLHELAGIRKIETERLIKNMFEHQEARWPIESSVRSTVAW